MSLIQDDFSLQQLYYPTVTAAQTAPLLNPLTQLSPQLAAALQVQQQLQVSILTNRQTLYIWIISGRFSGRSSTGHSATATNGGCSPTSTTAGNKSS